MEKLTIFFFGILLLLCCSGCTESTTAGIPAVQCFDAARYEGGWYEIARMPNWFEREMTHVKAHYSVHPDGTLKVVNSGLRRGKLKSITGRAWFTVRPDVGMLRVRFFYPFSGVYKIIYLDRSYSVAVVTGKDYSLLWILARKPHVGENELTRLLQWITALGYDSSKLVFTKQKSCADRKKNSF